MRPDELLHLLFYAGSHDTRKTSSWHLSLGLGLTSYMSILAPVDGDTTHNISLHEMAAAEGLDELHLAAAETIRAMRWDALSTKWRGKSTGQKIVMMIKTPAGDGVLGICNLGLMLVR